MARHGSRLLEAAFVSVLIRRKRTQARQLLVAATVVVLAATSACSVVGDDDSSGGVGDGDKVVLEPINASPPDPFMDDNLDTELADGGTVSRNGSNTNPPPSGDNVTATLSGQLASGNAPGLYGGTMNSAACDIDKLVAFLTDPANTDKATAWAEVQGIEIEEIADYIADLTPLRVRYDTRITNHSFVDGQAQPFQSIIQAGTAVLVDNTGTPRTKCYCGNPLLEPAPLDTDTSDDDAIDIDTVAANPDDAWEGLDAKSVITVEAGEPMDHITAADMETGQLFQRPTGTKGDQDQPGGQAAADGSQESPGSDDSQEDPGSPATTTGGGGGGSTTYTCIVTLPNGEQFESETTDPDNLRADVLAEGATSVECSEE